MKKIKNYNQFVHENYVGTRANKIFRKRRRKHQTALEMEKRGAGSEEIRLATGWFRNEFDQKWRYELDSHKLALKPVSADRLIKDRSGKSYVSMKLHEMLENTSLFTEYPELREVDIALYPWVGQSKACYYSDVKLISVWEAKFDLGNKGDILHPNYKGLLFNIVIHELQHAIQDIEGFAAGANSRMFKDRVLPNGEVDTAETQYMNTAGEIEARDVEHRAVYPKRRDAAVGVWVYDKDGNSPNGDFHPMEEIPFREVADAVKYKQRHEQAIIRKYRELYGEEYTISVEVDTYQSKATQKPIDHLLNLSLSFDGRTKDDVTVRYHESKKTGNEESLLAKLADIRAFLQTKWDNGHSHRQCIRTVYFLNQVLGGSVKGGWVSSNPAPGAKGGFMDSTGKWNFHYWNVIGYNIVDITSDQFGEPAVNVLPLDDRRYHGTATASDLKNDFKFTWEVVDPWIEEYKLNINP